MHRVITHSKLYRQIYDRGNKIVKRHFVFFYLCNDLEYMRFGAVASKKVGNAIKRNRCKRRIRALFRDCSADYSYDVIVVARMPMFEGAFSEIAHEFKNCIDRL